MERKTMGSTSRADTSRGEADSGSRRYSGNAGSFDQNRANLDAGAATRFERKHPLPSPGDRFGELTVVGVERTRRGACDTDLVRVQCSCGAAPHLVFDYNLRKGASTRCGMCARKASGYWRKSYSGYADVCPDDAHRTRLLDRISAAINRCGNPSDSGYHNYGGRGILVHQPWQTDRRAFLAHLLTLDGWDKPENDMDRIEVNRGYEPGNIRFIPAGQNRGSNKRTVKEMQQRIADLEARLRSAERGARSSFHGDDIEGSADRP